jgi:hypothetical protein
MDEAPRPESGDIYAYHPGGNVMERAGTGHGMAGNFMGSGNWIGSTMSASGKVGARAESLPKMGLVKRRPSLPPVNGLTA